MTDKIRRRPGEDPIIFHIHRLSRSIMRASMAQYMKSYGLGVPQVQILNALGAHGTLSSKEIVTYIAMNKALVSRSLSQLTDLDYTAPAFDADDARRSLWKLTRRGEDFVATFRPMLLERRAKLMKVLSLEEQELLTQFIEKLYASSEQLGREESAARRKRNPVTTRSRSSEKRRAGAKIRKSERPKDGLSQSNKTAAARDRPL